MKHCTPGMILGKNMYATYGTLLLSRGSVLELHHINRLDSLGYVGVYIEDEFSGGIEVREVVDPLVREYACAAVEGLFNSTKLSENNAHLLKEIEALLDAISNQILANRDSVVSLASLKTLDNYTYQHSVDVGILSLIIGKAFDLSKDEMMDLGRAAFFHDIGLMFISDDIVNKPTALTPEEYEGIKKHPEFGYTYLSTVLHQPKGVAQAALYHHERFGGEGYPKGVTGESTPLYAQIIAVADVYDALTSKRTYRNESSPSEAYEHIMSEMGSRFSPAVVNTFVRKIAPFPVGACVNLSDGRQAVVVKNYPSFMMRPIVKIMDSKDNIYIDLSNDPSAMSITVVEIVK